jgi:hypothetical protein
VVLAVSCLVALPLRTAFKPCNTSVYTPYRALYSSQQQLTSPAYNISTRTAKETSLPFLLYYCVAAETSLFAEPLPSNGCCIVAYFAVVA